ncbi:MAG: glutamine--fructose-6-phosphate transaminase (isomerizing), partial [Clostridia bacterium]|nr:glutamine--fructose-6-phosphate transaminase (isomerizing) [Clostridia bacterium]
NGIIENYACIKERLINKGYLFESDTDTEIACGLINDKYNDCGDPLKAIASACEEMEGSYAFCIMFSDIPDSIFATRKESPLLILPFDRFTAVCSDLTAINANYSSYYLPEEKEIAVIRESERHFFDFYGKQIIKHPTVGNHRSHSHSLDGYSSYMEKEINDQPEIIEKLLREYVNDNKVDFGVTIPCFRKLRMIGCGTAFHAALTASYFFNAKMIQSSCHLASEFRYSPFYRESDTLYAVISQSGETADTVAAMRYIQKHGQKVVGIVNAPESTVAREADYVIDTKADAELAVASTKAFTAQVAILAMLSSYATGDVEILNSLKATPNALREVLAHSEDIQRVSAFLAGSEHAFYIGRQIDSALACEGSLKLKEITYIHSEALPAGELKHGTLSLVTEGTPALAPITNIDALSKTSANIKEIMSRGGVVFTISTHDNAPMCVPPANRIVLPNSDSITSVFSATAIMQLIALRTAEKLNRDVDKPRNLAKSVTVE